MYGCPTLEISSPANSTIDAGEFYISYNDRDVGVNTYGCDTTALVFGQGEHFYVLNGDHIKQYAALLDQGFAACLGYFEDHAAEANRLSETTDCKHVVNSNGSITIVAGSWEHTDDGFKFVKFDDV